MTEANVIPCYPVPSYVSNKSNTSFGHGLSRNSKCSRNNCNLADKEEAELNVVYYS